MLKKILFAVLMLFSVSNLYTMERGSFWNNVGSLLKQATTSHIWVKHLFEEDKDASEQTEILLYHLPEVLEDSGRIKWLQKWVKQIAHPDERHLAVFFNAEHDFKDRNGALQPIIETLITKCSGPIGSLKSADGVTPLHYLMATTADNSDPILVKSIMNRGGDPLEKGYFNDTLISPLEVAVAQKKRNYAKLLANKSKVSYGITGLQTIFGKLNKQRAQEGFIEIPSETVSAIERFTVPTQEEIVVQCAMGEGSFVSLP